MRIAAAVLLDAAGRMLVVKKRGSPWFMQPGGKIEPGESPVDALARELAEEVSLQLTDPTDQGVFEAPAANEPGAKVVAHIFSGRPAGTPRIGREIQTLDWLDPAAPGALLLAPLTRDHMLPLAYRLGHETGELRSPT